jgi:hypothetical protein
MSDISHHLIAGWFFTDEQWRGALAPYVDRLVSKPGGVLLIAVDLEPARRNYPTVAFGVFDARERKALKSALEKARRGREKSHQDARGDLAEESEGKGSGAAK